MFEKLKDPHTQQMLLKLLRQALPALGGFLVGKGVVTASTWGLILANWETIGGSLIAAGSAIWMIYQNTKVGIVEQANELNETKGVIMKDTVAGRAIALAAPSKDVVPANTNAAKDIAA